jgi:hypothetical protein
MAILLLRTERAAAALDLAQAAQTSLAEAYGDDHWRTAWAASTMGASLTELSRYKDAETVLLKSYMDLQDNSGARAIHVDTTRQYLADLYTGWSRPEEAARYSADSELGL